jgi:hypothetical protein
MKNKLLLLMLVIFIFAASTAKGQAQAKAEYEKVDTKVELLLDSAAKHMLLFILSKNEAEYNISLKKIEEAELLNKELEPKLKLLKGNALELEKEELEDRKGEFASYHDEKLKEIILNEADKDRTQPVKFHGKAYKLGKTSKAKYDVFNIYLPKN